MKTLQAVLAVLLLTASVQSLQIFSASTFLSSPSTYLSGSLRGGRIIYIQGSDFPSDPTMLQVFVGSYPCKIPADGVTPVTLSCETTDTLSVTDVKSNSITVISQGQVYTVPSTLFDYLDGDTPIIYNVFPSSSIAGASLNFLARHRILNVGDGLRDMGDFYGLYIGDSICSMFDITQSSVTYNSINNVKCTQSQTQKGGRYNVSEHVVAGWSKTDYTMRKPTLDHVYYEHSVHPAINSITPNSGFSTGQDIVITGTGFSTNPSDITVTVDGVTCGVQSSTLSTIKCSLYTKQSGDTAKLSTLDPSTQTKGYIGGAGFSYARYDTSGLASPSVATFRSALTSNSPSITLVQSGQRMILESLDIYGATYGQVFKGYFYAPNTGNYTFRGAADDQFALFMNLDYGTANGTLTQIISSGCCGSNVDNYYISNISTTFGAPQLLQGGQYYYTQVYHINTGGSGYFKVSVQVPNTDTTLPKQTFEVNHFETTFTNGPELLNFTLNGAVGGSFNLSFTRIDNTLRVNYSSEVTLAHNATASQFQTALAQFDAYNQFTTSVTGAYAFDASGNPVSLSSPNKTSITWSVKVIKYRGINYLVERFKFKGNNLINSTDIPITFTQTTVANHSPLISGTFTLDIGGQSIKIYDSISNTYSIYNIPYNVAASTLQSALRRIVGFENVQVYKSGTSEYGSKWIISYYQYPGDVPDIVLSANLLTGGLAGTTPKMGFYQTRKWSADILFNPVNENLMFSAVSSASVIVNVNGVYSVCNTNDCSYTFINANSFITAQTISSSDPLGGTISVTISDPSNNNYALSTLTAIVDQQPCTIVSGSFASFTCTLPMNAGISPVIRAGSYDIYLSSLGSGVIGVQSGVSKLVFDLVLTSLSSLSGGTNGGYTLTINGKGFPSDRSSPVITLCGVKAIITQISNTQTTIIVPACTTVGAQDINYLYNGINKQISFSYTTPVIVPVINSVSPSTFNPTKKGIMIISGSGFGTSLSDISIYLANSTGKVYQMRALSVNDTTIKAGIPGGLPGNFKVQVAIAGLGDIPAANSAANTFTYEFSISNVSSNIIAYYGGTLVTINGINFSPIVAENVVSIGDQLNDVCQIQTVNGSQITCRMPPYNSYWGTNNTQRVTMTSRLILDSVCPGNNCNFTYNALDVSPVLRTISSASVVSGTGTLTLTGINLASSAQIVLQNNLTGDKYFPTVNSASSTSVNFTMPNIQAGVYAVRARVDPAGETNSLYLKVNASFTSASFGGSTQGPSMKLTGTGLPASWPPQLFTVVITLNSIPIKLDVLTATPSLFQVAIPSTTVSLLYSITITTPLNQVITATYTQQSTYTPALKLLNMTAVSSGLNTISINRTSLTTKTPVSISVYNVLNPTSLSPVTNWTYSGTFINFNYNFDAGKYGFILVYADYGIGNCINLLQVTAAAPYTNTNAVVSLMGGQMIVSGTDISNNAVLRVGGFVGKLISKTASDAIFEVPPLITQATMTQYPSIVSQKVIIPTTVISDGGSSPSSAFDKYQASYYSSSNTVCFIGLDVGVGKLARITRIRYFPYYKWTIAASYIKGAVFEGSLDGTTYTQIIQVDQTVHAGWNSILLATPVNYRYVRLRHTSASGCKLSELEINGYVLNDLTVADITDFTIDATLDNGQQTFPFTSSVRYLSTSTPTVTNINPNTGTIYGGTTVTFTGTNFNVGTPSVVIDGVTCVVDSGSVTATSFNCVTGSRLTLPQQNTFKVNFGSQKSLLQDQFIYVMRWSDVNTWGTDLPPIQGDLVYVPQGMTLLVDQSTPRLDGIIVQGGKLIFSDEADMEIHTNLITLNGGEFRAGTQARPYQNLLTFIMYGSYYGKQQPMFGNKGIGCMNCKFSMYGTPRTKTWTVIATTINPGDTTFTVQDAVDWQVGEEIVVASTSFDHNEAEQRTISAVSGNTFTVNQPFQYKHVSVVETYGSSDRLEMKAQVGLLTRNIKMMGDPTSEAGEYGSHLMLTGNADSGFVGKVAYTEFTHCGQPRIVGRYCMHFHMAGDVADSYALGNAVHHSFARVITIHGVRFLRVAQNVGYRVKGHNFFIEDGIETQNVIENNLAIGSLESWNMMQTDISVASFWITNPTNHLRNNRAAGGDFYGFWYEIKARPDGPSATNDVCPIGNPLGESHDNVAHSYKRFGLRIFKLYSRSVPCSPIRDDTLVDPWSTNPSIQSRFYNYVLYKNGESGLLAEETGNVLFENFTIAESKLAGMEFYRANLTKQFVQTRNFAIIGLTTANPPVDPSVLNGGRGVIGPRSGQWKMSNVRFYNFPVGTTVLQTCSKCNDILLYTNTGQQYFTDGITFTNVTGNYLSMKGLKRQIIYDTDGSFSSNINSSPRVSSTIVWGWKHIAAQPSCTAATTPSKWDNAIACNEGVTIRKTMFTNLINPDLFTNMHMRVQLLSSQTEVVLNTSTSYSELKSRIGAMDPEVEKPGGYSIPFVTNRVYNIWWQSALDFTHLAIDVSKLFTDSDSAIIFKFPYTENRELYEIGQLVNKQLTGGLTTPTITALDKSTCSFGDYTHDNSLRVLTICGTSRGKFRPYQYLDVNGIKCRYLCPSPAGEFVKEPFLRLWSNVTQWPQGRLPLPNENVTISGNWTIMMDMSPAPMQFFHIDGDVIIPPNMAEINITAASIWIRAGSLKAGNSSGDFPGNIKITITGNKGDAGYALTPDIAGNKLFVIHGRLQLYGSSPSVTWARATSFARAGATSVSVSGSIAGWEVGGQVVIGPTWNDPTQDEIVTITAVNTGTNTITFTPALNFSHYGAPGVTVNNTVGILDTRAAVGYLSRKIQIVSGADEGWGYQMLLHAYNDNSTLRSGSAVLKGVHFYMGGQYDTENTALKIWNTIDTHNIVLIQNSFHNCLSYCLDINNINNAVIKNNVFYKARLIHVRAIQLNNYIFNNNLMIAATKRPTVSASVFQLITCYMTYDSVVGVNASITSNLCQGSQLHGFALSYIPCDSINNSPYSDNTVGSAIAGFIFNKISSSCVAATGIKAYACKIAQIASSPNTEQLMFQNFMVADSGRGVTLRFGLEGDDRTAYFSNSYVSAISRPTCSECYGPSAIDCTSNFGVRMLAVTVNGETLPSKFGTGFDVICKQEVFDSKAFLQNIIFQNFNQVYSNLSQCSKNVIFKPHDIASDLTGSHHLKNVVCNGCAMNAMALFTPPDAGQIGWFGGCGKILCTGKNNYLIHDHTGNLFGSPSILLANNSEIGDNTPGCTFISQINGHHCLRQDLAVLQYENIAPDFNTRIMWPVYLKFDGGSWNTSTNGWKEWDWQGNQPQNHRLGRFISVVQLYKVYNMTFESEPPIDMRFQIQQRSTTGNPEDWVVIKLYYPRPNSIRVQTRFGIVRPITLLTNNGQNPLNTSICGSNKFFYQNYTIHFVVTADKNCQVRVSLTNSIQLTARLDMDINAFYAASGTTLFIDRVCSVLGITDTSRLKVVAIYNGSVSITAFIDESLTTTTSNSTSANNSTSAQQMANLQNLITTVNSNGALGSSLVGAGLGPLLSLDTIIYIHPREDTDNTVAPEQAPAIQKLKTNIGLIVGVVVGVTVIAAISVATFIHCLRKRARVFQIQSSPLESDEQKLGYQRPAEENYSNTNFESLRK